MLQRSMGAGWERSVLSGRREGRVGGGGGGGGGYSPSLRGSLRSIPSSPSMMKRLGPYS